MPIRLARRFVITTGTGALVTLHLSVCGGEKSSESLPSGQAVKTLECRSGRVDPGKGPSTLRYISFSV